MGVQVIGEDTIYLGFLPEINIFAPLKFKNKRQEQFYWRTVRDVKKCLPYAKRIAKDIQYADAELAQLDPKERKKWWRNYEKQLFRTYEDDFRHMTASL